MPASPKKGLVSRHCYKCSPCLQVPSSGFDSLHLRGCFHLAVLRETLPNHSPSGQAPPPLPPQSSGYPFLLAELRAFICQIGLSDLSPAPREMMWLPHLAHVHEDLCLSFTHSLIRALLRHLWSAGAGEAGARREQGPWCVQGRQMSANRHPSALIAAGINSLRTSSGHCGLRSGASWPPSEPLVGRGPSSVSHASCSESAPCPPVSRTPASGQSSLKVLDDKAASGAFSER